MEKISLAAVAIAVFMVGSVGTVQGEDMGFTKAFEGKSSDTEIEDGKRLSESGSVRKNISPDGGTQEERQAPVPVPLILDTDMESDVDDVGALAMLHALADRGEIDLLGVMVGAENPWSTLCADRVNSYFNRPDLPLGRLKGDGEYRSSAYAKTIAEEFDGTLDSAEEAPCAVDQYRKLLASQPDHSVIILTIGYLTNLRNLLASEPDSHSDLNGQELVEQKVKKWVCMGGQFPEGLESNIGRYEHEAAIEAINNWPTEIIFSGWEIGRMDTGHDILDLPPSNPVRRAYELFDRIPHKSWDQVATLFAARGLDDGPAAHYWEFSDPGYIEIEEAGDNAGYNRWVDDPEGTQRYLRQVGSDDDIAEDINELMYHLPKGG